MMSFEEFVEQMQSELDPIEEKFGSSLKSAIAAGLIAASPMSYSANARSSDSKLERISQVERQREKVKNIIAMTLYKEARGESARGIYMVATVIWNRAGGDLNRFGPVCLAEKQFSCWNELPENERSVSGFYMKSPIGPAIHSAKWIYCNNIAEEMLDGQLKPIGRINCYYNPDKLGLDKNGKKIIEPSWGPAMEDKTKEGKHIFGYLKYNDGFRRGGKK